MVYKLENPGGTGMKFNLRVNGKVTSISLNSRIVALWLVLSDISRFEDHQDAVGDFVQRASMQWDDVSARGLSEYILNAMLREILDKKDFSEYRRIYKDIQS